MTAKRIPLSLSVSEGMGESVVSQSLSLKPEYIAKNMLLAVFSLCEHHVTLNTRHQTKKSLMIAPITYSDCYSTHLKAADLRKQGN
jgi:hypothetical protein